jgi:hypothetical protein
MFSSYNSLISTVSAFQEDMLQIGITKLQLDDAVGGVSADGDAETSEAKQTEIAVKKSLLTNLRAKLDGPKQEDVKDEGAKGDGVDDKME